MAPGDRPPTASPDGAAYTAADVKQAAGLSYRQLNDWERKGLVPESRDGGEGWRKFTFKQVFTLVVLAEFRSRFGVPPERLKWLQSVMLQPVADHFRAAVELMVLGMSVVLFTDLSETFVMDTDAEIEDLIRLGWFRSDEPQGYYLLKMNPLVNRVLACLKEPVQLQVTDRVYNVIRQAEMQDRVAGAEEKGVLELIRESADGSVTVHLKGGQIRGAEVESERPIGSSKREIQELLDSDRFQTVTVLKHDGKVARLTQRRRIKFTTGVPRQREPERSKRSR